MNSNIIVFFDIDYTLFDTARFREKLFGMLAADLHMSVVDIIAKHQEVIDILIEKKGFFDPTTYANIFSVAIGKEKESGKILAAILKDEIFLDNYYKEIMGVLEELSGRVNIGIFSKGETSFQRKKLHGIKHFFKDHNIHITVDKHKTLPEFTSSHKGKTIYFVDDALDVLHTAKLLSNDITVIWVKRGKYAQKQLPIAGFTPDAIIENLSELIPLIKDRGIK